MKTLTKRLIFFLNVALLFTGFASMTQSPEGGTVAGSANHSLKTGAEKGASN